jgi:HD-GYP domain-containing protein (c-di-GMP phosphodiesterase class II)
MDVILPDQLPDLLARRQAEAASAVAVAEAPLPAAAPTLTRFSQQLRALSALNAHLICMDGDKPVYNQMVQGVGRVLNADLCALYLLSPATDHLDLVGVAGAELPGGKHRLDLDEVQRPAVQAFQEEYLIHVQDLLLMNGVNPLLQGCRSLLAMPIMGREGPVGAFEFARRTTGGFTGEEIDLAGVLVDQMAYQLENYRLIRQLSASRDAVIHGMARLAESRGGDIGGHLDRICAYAQLLASRLLGRPGYLGVVHDEWVATLTRAAALHDIGKVGIPDRILLKPGALDEDEYLTMKTHARLGAEILQDLMLTHGPFPMLEMGTEIALSHHERWDGSGYPQGLKGTAIPLSARIVALADVYDALTSKRVYKSAWTREETLSQVIGLAGSHFDPDLVAIFLQDADELEKIQKRFPD